MIIYSRISSRRERDRVVYHAQIQPIAPANRWPLIASLRFMKRLPLKSAAKCAPASGG